MRMNTASEDIVSHFRYDRTSARFQQLLSLVIPTIEEERIGVSQVKSDLETLLTCIWFPSRLARTIPMMIPRSSRMGVYSSQ